MGRIVAAMALLLLGGGAVWRAAGADDPRPKERPPVNYTITGRTVQKLGGHGPDGKWSLEEVVTVIPAMTLLEGARGEYHNGGKLSSSPLGLGSTPFGFTLEVRVNRLEGKQMRLAIRAESRDAEANLGRSYRQKVARLASLGKMVRIDLARPKNGEDRWIELTVREAGPE